MTYFVNIKVFNNCVKTCVQIVQQVDHLISRKTNNYFNTRPPNVKEFKQRQTLIYIYLVCLYFEILFSNNYLHKRSTFIL